MKTLLLTTLLIGCMSVGMGQTLRNDEAMTTLKWNKLPDSIKYKTTWAIQSFPAEKIDTTACLAYVCTDYDKAKFKWIHMFVITTNRSIYSSYLMPDRKTKSIYKVIYSLTK